MPSSLHIAVIHTCPNQEWVAEEQDRRDSAAASIDKESEERLIARLASSSLRALCLELERNSQVESSDGQSKEMLLTSDPEP